MPRPVSKPNQRINNYIKKLAHQGGTVASISNALSARRMNASNARIGYYVKLAKEGPSQKTVAAKPVRITKLATPNLRVLKILESEYLTSDEKIALAANVLKAKTTTETNTGSL